MLEFNLLIEMDKPVVSVNYIEPKAELKFVETGRAKGKRSGIALFQMIGPVQNATKEYAMPQ